MLQFGRLSGALPKIIPDSFKCGSHLVAQCFRALCVGSCEIRQRPLLLFGNSREPIIDSSGGGCEHRRKAIELCFLRFAHCRQAGHQSRRSSARSFGDLCTQSLAAVFGTVKATGVVLSDGPLDPLHVGFQCLRLDRQLSEVDDTRRPPGAEGGRSQYSGQHR
jgi:hypothetical protein